MSVKAILFPFINKRPDLKKSAWHRLMVVIYFISLLPFLLWSWFLIMNFEYAPTQNCIDLKNFINSYDISECFALSSVHHITDLFIAIALTIIASYLIQIIYHKVILYIILGNSKKD